MNHNDFFKLQAKNLHRDYKTQKLVDGNYIYTLAQWYPRMCVFDDYEGWQNKQYLGKGEFSLTFGKPLCLLKKARI